MREFGFERMAGMADGQAMAPAPKAKRKVRHWRRFLGRRFIADAVLGLALFLALATLSGAIGPAGATGFPDRRMDRPIEAWTTLAINAAIAVRPLTAPQGLLGVIDRPGADKNARARPPADGRQALTVLACVFSLLVAMNMALLRHLVWAATSKARIDSRLRSPRAQ